ncbi:MAG: hypothetical protein K8F93_01235, partial [Burkholderiales bacterium]|nr:hypothetical protein [Burkholderiales bacterium]
VNAAEAIAAGDAAWTPIPAPPVAVHGVGGAIHGNAFHLIGGSRVAATAVNTGTVQVYRFGPSRAAALSRPRAGSPAGTSR